MIHASFQLSIFLLIGAAVIFSTFLVYHLCQAYGLYNRHRTLQERRQKYQKINFNLHVIEHIEIFPANVSQSANLSRVQEVQQIPLKAVRFDDKCLAN
jgi:hypothetical protein